MLISKPPKVHEFFISLSRFTYAHTSTSNGYFYCSHVVGRRTFFSLSLCYSLSIVRVFCSYRANEIINLCKGWHILIRSVSNLSSTHSSRFLHFVPLHKCEFTDAHRFRIRIKNGLEKTIPFRFVVRCLRCKQNDWVGLFPTHEDSIGNELFSVPLFHPFVQIAFRILHFYSQISLSCLQLFIFSDLTIF